MIKPAKLRTAKEYFTSDGKSPFNQWLISLKDVRAKVKITKAIIQMELGNFGDHKSITGCVGLFERRIHFGPGYRIYYVLEDDELIILFAGSSKANQDKVIRATKEHLHDYLNRKKQGEC